jgi:hypothetical protein
MYVGEVIKKTSVIGEFFPEEAQRVNNALSRLRHRDVTAFLPDADCRQAKACGGNAGDYAVVNRADIAPVFHHAGVRIDLLPEVTEIQMFDFLKKLIVFRREWGFGRERRECRGLAAGFCYKGQKRSTRRQAGKSPHYFTPRILSLLRFVTHSLGEILNYLLVRRETWKPEE